MFYQHVISNSDVFYILFLSFDVCFLSHLFQSDVYNRLLAIHKFGRMMLQKKRRLFYLKVQQYVC
jgi:hypothetical protein